MMRPVALAGLALLLTSASHAFLSSSAPTRPITTTTTSALLTAPNDAEYDSHHQNQDRRRFLTWAATTALVTAAGATPGAYGDPAALTTQGVTRSRQVEAVNQPESDAVDQLWEEELPGGVSYREYRRGKGDAVVTQDSRVTVEMTVRCRSFANANEPGGLKYYSTEEDTAFNELDCTAPPGLEEAMRGMKEGGVRRIELPSTQVFAARHQGQLPLPQTKDGQRLFERLFKTDATLLFDVLVTSIK